MEGLICPICGDSVKSTEKAFFEKSLECSNEFFAHDKKEKILYRYVESGADDDNAEEWREVPNHPDYIVSSLGRIQRLSVDGVSTHVRRDGYVALALNRIPDLLHRVVLKSFLGIDPKRPQGNHLTGVKTDNRLVALEWTTGSENQKHKYKYLNPKKGNLAPVIQFIDGRFAREFSSIKQASDELSIPYSTIVGHLSGSRKTCHGFVFKRKSTINPN